MARTHEVPNHLNVEDTLFLGLTARQVATLMAFASPAYGIWDQLTDAPVAVRGALAALVLLVGIAFTLVATPAEAQRQVGPARGSIGTTPWSLGSGRTQRSRRGVTAYAKTANAHSSSGR